MIKKFLSVLIALVAVTTAAGAQDVSGIELGYCGGEVSTKGQNAFSCSEEDACVSAAIYLPASALALYNDCSINQIHAGMASVLNVDELEVWVRESLDGENLASAKISKQTDPKMAKGWNTVTLDQPYLIAEGNQGVYVGLTFHQTSVSVGLSVVTPDAVAPVEGGLFVQMGSEAEWADRHEEGTLAIEALVFGDKLPKYNVMLKDLFVLPTFVIDKKALEGTVTVRNIATATITGFDIVCTIDGADALYTVPVETSMAYKDEITFPFEIYPEVITSSDPATRTITVTIANLKEGDDQDPSDNTLSADFEVVAHDFARNVLIEEFTTENCPNCPRVANVMHEMLEDEEMDARCNVICHHSAYYTDWLTIPQDNDYMWLFNMGGSTFAPAVTIDRVTNSYISNNEENSPIHSPKGVSEFIEVVKRRMKEVAYVCVNVEAELVDGEIKVKVDGERIKDDITVNPARIVVALVEDNIKARAQASGGSDYVHQHTNRDYNATWGEVLNWDGDTYKYECSFKLDNRYVKENLVVVAYIWDYDPLDVTACHICNSGRVRYADMLDNTTAVAELEAPVAEEYYTIDGLRIAEPQNGLNIVRRADGSVAKVMISK